MSPIEVRSFDAAMERIAELERENTALQQRAEASERERDELQEPLPCEHVGANLQPTDGPGDACIVCAEIAKIMNIMDAERREQARLINERDTLRADLGRCMEQVRVIKNRAEGISPDM